MGEAEGVTSFLPASAKPTPKPGTGCPHGLGVALSAGVTADAGAFVAGAGAQSSGNVGAFASPDGPSVGAYSKAGIDAYFGPSAAGTRRAFHFPGGHCSFPREFDVALHAGSGNCPAL